MMRNQTSTLFQFHVKEENQNVGRPITVLWLDITDLVPPQLQFFLPSLPQALLVLPWRFPPCPIKTGWTRIVPWLMSRKRFLWFLLKYLQILSCSLPQTFRIPLTILDDCLKESTLRQMWKVVRLRKRPLQLGTRKGLR
jgi:hypothetical protein